MHYRCPANECEGHDLLVDVVVHGLEMLAEGQAAIVRELRHPSRVPAHVQAGMNALDEQIRAADRTLNHQSGIASTQGEGNP